MRIKYILATNNANKVKEIKAAITTNIELLSLEDVGIFEDVPEPHNTIGENAIAKAAYVYEKTQMATIAEDTGLIIEALNGEPGVRSARYAGAQRNSEDNINLVLQKLADNPNRNASFYTVMTLCVGGKLHTFDGECKGVICHEVVGKDGFGYDPIFKPNGSNKTFGEMMLSEKQAFSHRKKALDKLIAFINQPK